MKKIINKMYSNDISVNLKVFPLGGQFLLRIRVGNEHAESSRFITSEEAENSNVLLYWLETLIDDVIYYCNKKEN